jgi:hypothetical protein
MSATWDNNDNETNETTHPPCLHSKEMEVIMQTFDLNDKAKHLMYTNQTGRFPKKSSHGNQYIMVLIEIDSNAIRVEAMKNQTAGEMIRAYQVLVNQLKSRSYTKNAHLGQ